MTVTSCANNGTIFHLLQIVTDLFYTKINGLKWPHHIFFLHQILFIFYLLSTKLIELVCICIRFKLNLVNGIANENKSNVISVPRDTERERERNRIKHFSLASPKQIKSWISHWTDIWTQIPKIDQNESKWNFVLNIRAIQW